MATKIKIINTSTCPGEDVVITVHRSGQRIGGVRRSPGLEFEQPIDGPTIIRVEPQHAEPAAPE